MKLPWKAMETNQLWCKRVTSLTRGPNRPPLVQKRHISDRGPQPTSFGAKTSHQWQGDPTDLLWCKSSRHWQGDPTDLLWCKNVTSWLFSLAYITGPNAQWWMLYDMQHKNLVWHSLHGKVWQSCILNFWSLSVQAMLITIVIAGKTRGRWRDVRISELSYCITNSILYNRGLFDVWYLSFSMCGHFLHASTNQLRQLWFSSLELGISLFNPRKDFLDVFGQSGTMAQRACKATGPFIWSWICHFNLLFSANLDLPLVYELETLVFVTADIEDSIISISAGLAAVVLYQTLGPEDFFEWKQ